MNAADITKLPKEKLATVFLKIASTIEGAFPDIEVSRGHKFDDDRSRDLRIPSGWQDGTIFFRRRKAFRSSQGQIKIYDDGKIKLFFGFINSAEINHISVYEEIYKVLPDRLTCIECNGYTTSDYGMGAEPPHNVGEQEECRTCKGSGMYAPYKTYSVYVSVQVFEGKTPAGGKGIGYYDIEENCLNDAVTTAVRRAARDIHNDEDVIDALHPNGKCRCCGEGTCEWCVSFGNKSE